MIAAEISLAFNTANERKSWSARPNSRGGNGTETVHFTTKHNLVTLVYECESKRFAVRFNKYHATWGDYIRAIGRSLYVVLSTLKVAGLPFDCPDDIEGMEIVCTASEAGSTYVQWPPMYKVPPAFKLSATAPMLSDMLYSDDAPPIAPVAVGERPLTVRDAVRDAIMPEQDEAAQQGLADHVLEVATMPEIRERVTVPECDECGTPYYDCFCKRGGYGLDPEGRKPVNGLGDNI